jgi:DNA invertase Pin-like site-specific DNA recombinase
MGEMLARARAGAFDLLLTGYSDRWQRNFRRTLELLEDQVHPAGVALVMCDRRILSSDPHDRDELIAESASAERYSRRLSERITEGYEQKFAKQDDPGGHPALGFRRAGDRHLLEIDPTTIGMAVGLFERYALGTVSAKQLAAETGLADSRIRMILVNPLYNGWIRRHRGMSETRRPAPWRASPPVSDELWARVEEVRRGKTRGGGPKQTSRVDLLAGLLECACGRRLRSDGRFSDGRHRKLHPEPCEAWGRSARLPDETWETPVLAQVAGMAIDSATVAQVVAALGSGPRPIAIDRGRIERQMRDLALDHVRGSMDDAAYLERLGHLRTALGAVDGGAQLGVPADRAVAWLRALADTWSSADVPGAKAELLHAIYERIVVAGRRIISARLTPAAYAHGLALAMPEQVAMARPTVSEFTT